MTGTHLQPRADKQAVAFALRKTSPVPLYWQLKTSLETLIDSGEWPPDTQVPSERRLCQQFAISRITVRQALAELVREGRLVRSHGRGTFVADKHLRMPLASLSGFSEDMRRRGLRPGARVLVFELTSAPPHVARALRVAAGEHVVLLKRLMLANDRPMAVETVHLPARLCPHVLDERLDNTSLYDTLKRKYGIVPCRAAEQWQAIACLDTDARLLEIPLGSPVLCAERTTFGRQGQPFEHVESVFRGDRYIFFTERTRDGR